MSKSITANQREIVAAQSTITEKPEYLKSTNGALNIAGSFSVTGGATATGQTDGSQKTQIVGSGGGTVTVTGSKLDVNASIDTTGLATSVKQDTSNTSLASIDGKTPSLGQALMAASVPVTIASNQSGVPVTGTFWQATQPISGTVTANAGTNLNTSTLALESGGNLATLAGGVSSSIYQTNLKQVNGVTTQTGTGTAGTGTQRVAVASDSSIVLAAGTAEIGNIKNSGTFAVQAAQSGTWTTQPGNTANTTPWLTTDSATSSTGSAVPTKASYSGLLAKTANPTAASDGNLVGALSDKLGKQVVVGSIRDLKTAQQTTITSSVAETTVLSAVASTFLDVYGVIVANTSATATDVTFKDSTAGTTRFNIYVPAGDTRGFMLNESAAHPQATVNNNWTATCGTSVASVKITMLAVKNI